MAPLLFTLLCGAAVLAAGVRQAEDPLDSLDMEGTVTVQKESFPAAPTKRPAAFAMKIDREADPIVESVTPPRGPQYGGHVVLVAGQNFGKGDLSQIVYIAGVPCAKTAWVSSEALNCTLPAGKLGGNNTVAVQVLEGMSDPEADQVSFTYDIQKVHRVLPAAGPMYGGQMIDVYGEYFGGAPGQKQPWVYVDETPCETVVRVTETHLRCETPMGTPSGKKDTDDLVSVNVAVSGTFSPEAKVYTYQHPRVDKIDPPVGAAYGGTKLTITGRWFGPWGDNVTAGDAARLRPRVYIGEGECTDVERTEDGMITCTTSRAKKTGKREVIVRVGKGASFALDDRQRYILEPPTLDSVAPAAVPSFGGDVVTIRGRHLGSEKLAPKVFIDGVPCTDVVRDSDKELRCKTPPGAEDVTNPLKKVRISRKKRVWGTAREQKGERESGCVCVCV